MDNESPGQMAPRGRVGGNFDSAVFSFIRLNRTKSFWRGIRARKSSVESEYGDDENQKEILFTFPAVWRHARHRWMRWLLHSVPRVWT